MSNLKLAGILNLLEKNSHVHNGLNIKTKDLITLCKEHNVAIPGIIWEHCRGQRGFINIDKIKYIANTSVETPEKVTSNKNHEVVNTIMQEKQETSSPSKQKTHTDYSMYIPKTDDTFVPHGESYKILLQIIKSNMFFPVYIYGVSGIGKTSSVIDICAKLKKPFFRAQITRETIDDDLIGSMKLVDGNTIWNDGPVIQAYRSGGILLLDEIDLNNSLMILQPILENKPFYIKQTGELVHPETGFTVVATGNTKGTGESNGNFIGTTVLNDAFLDRFALTFEQEFPTIKTERTIILKYLKKYNLVLDDVIVDSLLKWIETSRDAYKNGNSDVFVSTRRVGFILKAMTIVKKPTKAIEITLSKFNDEEKDALLLLWKSIFATEQSDENNENNENINTTSTNEYIDDIF